MKEIENKKILFIGPRFYNYHLIIKENLELKGASVIFFEERIYGFLHILFTILGKKIYRIISSWRYRHLLYTNFDYLFIIRGESTPISFVQKFKINNPDAKCIMYQWDSLRNHNYSSLIKYFDKIFTFDIEDSNKISSLQYQPLFYLNDIEKVRKEVNLIQDIDLLVLSTYLPERYETILRLKSYCKKNSIKLYIYLYVPRARYYYEKYIHRVKMDEDIIYHSFLNKKEVLNLYSRSRAIVDISNINQTGLSMRVIECLACHRKLITTNRFICNQYFYNTKSVMILDPNNIQINKLFINDNHDDMAKQGMVKLRIDNWLNTIFNAG